MKLRKTKNEDIPKVLKIYNEGREALRKDGVDQWQTEGPSEESLRKDMAKDQSYVLEDNGEIVGTTANIIGVDPTYLEIDGRWLNEEDYLTIHRFAVTDKYKNKGYGQKMFYETEELAKLLGIKNIRVDTHKDNFKMNNLLLKLDYEYCGIIKLANGDLRNAYQKVLE